MELNAEIVKKALDWLNILVGYSDENEIAMLTYQLLGILYYTCEELTEKNAIQTITAIELDKQVQELTAELTKKETEYNELYELTEDLKAQCRYYAEAYHSVKVDTVRKMQERLTQVFFGDNSLADCICSLINTISKEVLEDKE